MKWTQLSQSRDSVSPWHMYQGHNVLHSNIPICLISWQAFLHLCYCRCFSSALYLDVSPDWTSNLLPWAISWSVCRNWANHHVGACSIVPRWVRQIACLWPQSVLQCVFITLVNRKRSFSLPLCRFCLIHNKSTKCMLISNLKLGLSSHFRFLRYREPYRLTSHSFIYVSDVFTISTTNEKLSMLCSLTITYRIINLWIKILPSNGCWNMLGCIK